MPVLHINEWPNFTTQLIKQKVFENDPFIIIDVGASGGVDKVWDILEGQVRFIGFEPNEEECSRLNKAADKRFTYLPYALADVAGTKDFYIAQHEASHSIYKNNQSFWERFNDSENLKIKRIETTQTQTLSAVLKEHGISNIDFIKVDVEGAELDVLKGAGDYLNQENCLGVLSEVRFTPDGSNCPVFWQLDEFLLNKGMRLFDLDCYRHSRRVLPYPYLYDYRNSKGEPIACSQVQGQLLWGDALYFHDLINSSSVTCYKILKLACLFEIHGLNDCAAELIIRFADILELDIREALDALVPEVKGERPSYDDYMKRKEVDERFLRPTYGLRYPEMIVKQYDGEFIPAWQKREPSFLKRIVKKIAQKLLRIIRG